MLIAHAATAAVERCTTVRSAGPAIAHLQAAITLTLLSNRCCNAKVERRAADGHVWI